MKKQTMKNLTASMQARIEILRNNGYCVKWYYLREGDVYVFKEKEIVKTVCEIYKKDDVSKCVEGESKRNPKDSENLKYARYVSFCRAWKEFSKGVSPEVEKPKLRACPFCGSSAAVHSHRCGESGYWQVVCDAGDASYHENGFRGCGGAGGYRETEKQAIDAWNRRA